jgi:hypothetical protein
MDRTMILAQKFIRDDEGRILVGDAIGLYPKVIVSTSIPEALTQLSERGVAYVVVERLIVEFRAHLETRHSQTVRENEQLGLFED